MRHVIYAGEFAEPHDTFEIAETAVDRSRSQPKYRVARKPV
jgi:hypothetical protein